MKAASNVQDRHLAGLLALQEEQLLRRHVLVCREPRRRTVQGIEILPWQEFMEQLWGDALVAARG